MLWTCFLARPSASSCLAGVNCVNGSFVLSLLFFFAFLLLNLVNAQGNNDPLLVSTQQGRVRGFYATPSVRAFLGIRYAENTGGSNRFKPPVELPTVYSSEIFNATSFGNVCLQIPSDSNYSQPLSEDCLFLNIWTPTNISKPLPVFFWIHGGAFKQGSGNIYSGDYWVQIAQDTNAPIVLVTINYRLGILGFLNDDMFLAENGKTSSNWGMLDQIAALKWVRNNIANFGGDVSKITIGGESAGGVSTLLHLATPLLSTSDFKSAIIQSGSALPWNIQLSKQEAQSYAANLKAKFNCNSPSCLRSLDAKWIIDYQVNATTEEYKPSIDGYYLPSPFYEYISNGTYKKVNLLIGTTRNEMTGFTCGVLPTNITVTGQKAVIAQYFGFSNMQQIHPQLHNYYTLSQYPNNLVYLNEILSNSVLQCNARYLAGVFSSLLYNTYLYIYDYHFSWVPACFQTAHAAELPMQFPSTLNVRSNPYTFTSVEMEFSKQMIIYWNNFVVSGNPNKNANNQMNLQPTQTVWPRYSVCNDTLLILQITNGQVNPVVNDTMFSKVCPFWNVYEQVPVLKCNTSQPIPPTPQPSPSPQVSPKPSSPKPSPKPSLSFKNNTSQSPKASRGVVNETTVSRISLCSDVMVAMMMLVMMTFWSFVL
ncbi:hypothetical protein FDP41_013593 [Naegleria fowleri]|uniref:Carboxylic ester hydrolase n=1 Tax=Naegleria fowleri TaxID=5763 RepID=A0A6A5C4W9_NAEFO|nr:uncharacterized protein FDP41_013593 [Naegleria fowleri]KAF0980379.1 hypothetical protein FDP41_013593 [Naegleria fowleri]